MVQQAWATYWRNSLADAESGKGGLSVHDSKAMIQVERSVRKTGMLSAETVASLFKDTDEKTHAVYVIYRPGVLRLTLQHGKAHQGSLPAILSALACPLWVNRQGYLFPAAPAVVPRDILAPQDESRLTIGSVAELDSFLTDNPFREWSEAEVEDECVDDAVAEQKEVWKAYIDHCAALYKKICQSQLTGELSARYQQADYSLVEPVEPSSGMSKKILALYDGIISHKAKIALFNSYASKTYTEHEACIDFCLSISQRLGHSSEQYALADAQRDALTHSLTMKKGDILAVNGPPGTGKTTYLLSVVASLWVEAALKQTLPPVICAASTNNQAVTNIIDAFGKDFSEGEGELSGRWLPDVTSYGAYFPSQQRQQSAQEKYQTQAFFDQVENRDYIERAEAYLLQRAHKYFSSDNELTLAEIKSMLHGQLLDNQSKLAKLEQRWHELSDIRECVNRALGHEPASRLAQLKSEVTQLDDKASSIQAKLHQWQAFLANESLWLSLFTWLKPVRVKRDLKRTLFIAANFTAEQAQLLPPNDYDQIVECLSNEIKRYHRGSLMLANEYQAKLALYKKQLALERRWSQLAESLGMPADSTPTLSELDKQLDTRIRFLMFRIAVHYWEACWLIENKALGDELNKIKDKTGKKTVMPRWQRRMMLTPCIVATFHTLPSLMTCQAFNDGGFDDEYLFDFVDLLVVDEAGQVSPDVAGASFSLAKKALVIGDVHQIEPIRSITGVIDLGNLFKQNLVAQRQDYETVLEQGRSVVNGSVMHIAQAASRYQYQADMEAGMYLREHRRCFDEIISFCNALCYKGVLLPKRGLSKQGNVLPSFGHLHIDGRAEQRIGGSRFNALEAETIADWLKQNTAQLEARYSKKLEQIVGVVTPFSAQVDELKQACKQHGISAGKDVGQLTVGTTHALQGAEREIIIFSPVYTRHSNGEFIDRKDSLLNVAVSRAKDSFLVFGDLDVISAASSHSPRGLLAKYLFSDASNELVFKVSQRKDLLALCSEPKLINNAKEHDQYLIETLGNVSQVLHIVSPWVNHTKLEEIGILAGIREAISRDVAVKLYTDRHFNTTVNNRFDTAKEKAFIDCCESLADEGVDVSVIRGVHSKLVMADDSHISVGSFNWFSAAREGCYANIETSVIYSGELVKEIKTQVAFLQSRVDKYYPGTRESQYIENLV
ncbi:AAA domain-containing protein [Shewanella sp. 10N.286.54.B9]|uniref:AAA domain-containing protein n=1 Tax=Shewanella sp. 10N.286.54.B9 TaxID=3229719 RepID=UPI00354F5B89